MPSIVSYIAAVLIAYLFGSIPVGMLVVRLISGRDIRQVGSGRTGGTNAFRAAGLSAGILTGVGDLAKGFAAVYVGHLLGNGTPALEALCGVAAVAGHNWPIFLRFKGGAGTGPNVGAATFLWPWTPALLIPLVAATLYTTGYASVASTAAGVVVLLIFIVRAIVIKSSIAYIGYALATLILTALALIPNYKRLAAGTERRVGPRAQTSTEPTKPE